MAVYDVQALRGTLVVLGAGYCGFTQRAVKALTEHRVPFYYFNVEDTREKYRKWFRKRAKQRGEAGGGLLFQPYAYDAQPRKRGVEHRSMPIVLYREELIGGNEQTQRLLADPSKVDALRAQLARDAAADGCVPIVAIPPGGGSVPNGVVALADRLVRGGEASFRYAACVQAPAQT